MGSDLEARNGTAAVGSLEAPSRGLEGAFRIHWVLTCKSLQNCDVSTPAPGAPVVEGSLELEFRHNVCAHALLPVQLRVGF